MVLGLGARPVATLKIMSQVHSNTPVELHEIATIFGLHTRCIFETILRTHFVSTYFVV